MDGRHFDTLTRALIDAGTRRGLLGLLASLPVLGGLVALLDRDETDAKRRRKKRHKHGKGRHKKKRRKKKCKAHSHAKTCAGKCGSVKNNCKKTVDCGLCACEPPCETCFTCQGEPGICVQDPVGTPCGQPGQVCQADATCACAADSCPACTTCGGDGLCSGCSGCCDGSICVSDCGDCRVCDDGQCAGCPDCCDGTICVAACPTCEVCAGGQCASCASLGQICCDNGCVSGVCCEDAACLNAGAPDCVDHECVCAANGDEPCDDGDTCCDDGCADLDTDPDHCGNCTNACETGDTCCAGDCVDLQSDPLHCGNCESACAPDFICVDGECHACDVVDGVNLAAVVAAAQDGQTLYVCAGTYSGGFNIERDITLIGAGQGGDGTVIQGGDTVVTIFAGGQVLPITLRSLRISGGGFFGVSIDSERHLTMRDCTVRDNGGLKGTGIFNQGTLLMTGCTIEDNSITLSVGGGLVNSSGSATLTDCLVQGNSAQRGGGIFNADPGAVLTLNNTVVRGNTATDGGDGGGGIFNDANGSTASVDADSLVCGNEPPDSQCVNVSDPSGVCQATCPTP